MTTTVLRSRAALATLSALVLCLSMASVEMAGQKGGKTHTPPPLIRNARIDLVAGTITIEGLNLGTGMPIVRLDLYV